MRIFHYKKARNLVEQHKPKNHLQELESAITDCKEILDTVFAFTNPVFEGDDAGEIQEYRNKLSEVAQFLLKKSIKLCENESAQIKKALDDLEELADDWQRINWWLEKVGGEARYWGLEDDDREEFQKAVALWAWMKKQIVIDLDDASLDKKYDYCKTVNRKEIRELLASDLARVFKQYTRRSTLNRTRDENAKKQKSPFQELIMICFSSMDERVTENALKTFLPRLINRA